MRSRRSRCSERTREQKARGSGNAYGMVVGGSRRCWVGRCSKSRGAGAGQDSRQGVRVWRASAGTSAGSRSRSLCGRAGRHEALFQVCGALRHQLHASQYLCRCGAGYSRAERLDRDAHRLFRADREQFGIGSRTAHAAWCAVGLGRSQCRRRLWRQAFQTDAAQRLQQLAGESGLRGRKAHRPGNLGLGVR